MNIDVLSKAVKFGIDFAVKMFGLLLLFKLTFVPALASANENWDKVKGDISLAAYLTEFPAEELAAVAFVESSFRARAKVKGGSAKGITQITSPTWNYLLEKYGPDYHLRSDVSPYDPRANAIMGAMYLTEIKDIMSHRLKREVTLLETYLGYKFSPYRAVRMLRAKESTSLLTFYPAAADRNQAVYYHKDGRLKTIGDVKAMFKKRLGFATKNYGEEANEGVVELKRIEFLQYANALLRGPKDCAAPEAESVIDHFERIRNAHFASIGPMVRPVTHTLAYHLNPTSGREWNGFLI